MAKAPAMTSLTATILVFLLQAVNAFVPPQHLPFLARSSRLLSAAESDTEVDNKLLSLSLTKPLGLILEEAEEGASSGVIVKQVQPDGSAADHADALVGAKLSQIQGSSVSEMSFDAVMDKIVNAPDNVELQFLLETPAESFDVGTTVTIQVLQKEKPNLSLSAKVRDNLRQTLLDNGFEVYQGLRQKTGNCGGAGQCTFCAVDFIESEGWLERSDYEDKKLKKFPTARLSCLNNIQGPATIRKTER